MNDSDKYDADYFLRGKESGKSLYTDYRWMPELTVPMVGAIISHIGIKCEDRILDFGCARGYTVRAFRERGYDAYGLDTSKWATDNCDPSVKDRITCGYAIPTDQMYNWIIAKDVLEHIPHVRLTIKRLIDAALTGIMAVVPLSPVDNSGYTVPEYEADVTHCQRLTLATWVGLFVRPGWEVTASYRVKGVKDNYSGYPKGNGFLVIRRIED